MAREQPTDGHGGDRRAPTNGHRPWSRLVQRRLLLQIALPGLIGSALLILAVVDLVSGHVPSLILLWLAPGLAVGYAFGRFTRVAWDSETSLIVQSGSGLALLLAFLGVRLGAGYLLSPRVFDWVYASNAAALVGGGLLLGRSLGTLAVVQHALDDRVSDG